MLDINTILNLIDEHCVLFSIGLLILLVSIVWGFGPPSITGILQNHFKADRFNVSIGLDGEISFSPEPNERDRYLKVEMNNSKAHIKRKYPYCDTLKTFNIDRTGHCLKDGGPYTISQLRDMI